MLVVAQLTVKKAVLIHFRVFSLKSSLARAFVVSPKKISLVIMFCVRFVTSLGVREISSYAQRAASWNLLGGLFKMSDHHPRSF